MTTPDASVPPLSPEALAEGKAVADMLIGTQKTDPQAHGALNPLAGSRATGTAWEFAPGVWAWMVGPDVVLQGEDGDVTIPGTHLAVLARSLLAAHVQNGRPEFRGQQ